MSAGEPGSVGITVGGPISVPVPPPAENGNGERMSLAAS